MKRIILASRPLYLPEDTIVIDCGSHRLWLGERAFPQHNMQYKPVIFRIAATLFVRLGRLVTWDELEDYIYCDDPNGGPCSNSRAVTLHRAKRTVFTPLGTTVTNRWGFGCTLNWTDGQTSPDVV